MNKIICNKHTLALAQKQVELAFKRCYLELKRVLEVSKNWDTFDPKKYKKCQKLLNEIDCESQFSRE